MSEITSFQGTASEYRAMLVHAEGYTGPWPHTRDHRPPMSVRSIAKRYPFRATLPVAPIGTLRKAMKAAGDRLAVTESSDPSQMWVWARDSRDVAHAVSALPLGTVFVRHDGTAF